MRVGGTATAGRHRKGREDTFEFTLARPIPMRRLLPMLLCALPGMRAVAQSKVNQRLKHELDSIYVVDQHYREMTMATFTPQGAAEVAAKLGMSTQQAAVYLSKQMTRTDSTNTQRISQIISKHGYPGMSLVSTPINEAAFYVIQHSQLIKQRSCLESQFF